MRGIALAGLLSILLWGQVSYAAEVGPAPRTYVEDRAGVMNAQIKTQLIGLLQELEQKAKARIIVLTVQTTDGMDIHQYTFERADQWKFGPNKKSAGVLIVVAVKDRKYRTEVGYDWEGILPDSRVGELGRKYFVPYFKQKAYSMAFRSDENRPIHIIVQFLPK
ncbi:TPM domain-containing protein [Patescibacteria group bacterium]|nr:TPM domain-containing protein [Patescibacteria group bacterium]